MTGINDIAHELLMEDLFSVKDKDGASEDV
jgi:hypothetical protein